MALVLVITPGMVATVVMVRPGHLGALVAVITLLALVVVDAMSPMLEVTVERRMVMD